MSELIKVAELTITEARVIMQRAEAAEKEEHRRKLVAQLAEIHVARVRAEQDYLKIAGQVKRERAERDRIRFEMKHVKSLLEEHARHRPPTIEYLPSTKESFVWTMEQGKLKAQSDKLLEQLKAVPDSLTIEAMKYEGHFGILAQMAYSERNLLQQLDSESQRKFVEGGIFPVEDM
jgi:hypothetical protein